MGRMGLHGVTRVAPEGLSNGGHAENDVQVGPDPLEEECIEVVLCLSRPRCLGRGPHFVQEGPNLILGEKVGNFPRG